MSEMRWDALVDGMRRGWKRGGDESGGDEIGEGMGRDW